MIWSLEKRRFLSSLKTKINSFDDAFAANSPNGDTIVTAHSGAEGLFFRGDAAITIWDAKTLTEKVKPIMWPTPIAGLTFSPDGENIILLTKQDAWNEQIVLNLLDAQTLEKKFTLDIKEGLTSIAYSPDGESIATSLASAFGTKLKLWDTQNGKGKI